MWPFSDFQDSFASFCSTADFLTVISDRMLRLHRSEAILALALYISKICDRVWHAGLLKLCLTEFQVGYLALFIISE